MHKSFLKWAGGKYDLLPTLIPIIQSLPGRGGRYIEPFVGGGSLALNIPITVPKMLNDINPGVVEAWTSLKRAPKSFVTYAASFFQSGFYNTEDRYYKQRDAFNFAVKHGGGDVTAALFLYLNRHCFNGLCRFNKKGEFNVPYGRYKTVYFPENELRHAGAIMQNATISSLDFIDVMNMAEENDVVYCDPPYVPLSDTSAFTSYSSGGFTIEQQWSLVARAERLRDRGVSVIISNNDTPLTRKMYKKADEVKKLLVSKRISCKADGRKKSGELIAIYRP
jgi:DNA adenine methylase